MKGVAGNEIIYLSRLVDFILLLIFADLCKPVWSQHCWSQAEADRLCGRLFGSLQSGQQGRLAKQLQGWSSKACALEASSLILFCTLIWEGQNLANRFQTEFVIMSAKMFEMFFCWHFGFHRQYFHSYNVWKDLLVYFQKQCFFLNKNLMTLSMWILVIRLNW